MQAMRNVVRRKALKALAAAAVAASGLAPARAAAEPRAPIERGAQLKLLRWKRYVQGDEDLWMANTARFTQRTGVRVQVESIVGEELRAKGAMVASVGAGPDILVGSPEMPHQYSEKCVDLTEVAGYLGQKYGGWYAAREYLRFMLEREQYEAWQQASLGYMCQTLRAYESNPIWASDPKVTPFRDGPRLTQYSAYPGKLGPASAAVAADLIIPQMFAEAASGRSSIPAAIARAGQRAKRYYR
jgi:ABC-type glycerol-3-phosphate transport system substrate-binding protein